LDNKFPLSGVSAASDLNTQYKAGIYYFSTNNTNTPCEYGHILVTVSDGSSHNNSNNWIHQLAFGTNNLIYSREKVNSGSWSTWKTIIDSSTIGAQSVSYASSAGTASSCSGNAATATQLKTARTISLTGDVTGSTTFNGSGNASITATVANDSHTHSKSTITSVSEANLEWGGKNFTDSYGCIDAAMVPELGSNRLAFFPANKTTVEYSIDGGSTWTAYGGLSDANKVNLFNSNGTNLYIGGSSASKIDKSKYMVRVTLETSSTVYTVLNKFVIYCSTSGSSGCYCTITGRTNANYTAGTNTWVTFAEKIPLSGWSGYNIINTSGITTYGNTSTHY
jgi:hypothetical protein